MNFEGRFVTEGNILVAVHKNGNCENPWKGHVIEADNVYAKAVKGKELVWDRQGNNVIPGDKAYTLYRRLNPQTYVAQVRIDGCEECNPGEVREEKKGVAKVVYRLLVYEGESAWVDKTISNSLKVGVNDYGGDKESQPYCTKCITVYEGVDQIKEYLNGEQV